MISDTSDLPLHFTPILFANLPEFYLLCCLGGITPRNPVATSLTAFSGQNLLPRSNHLKYVDETIKLISLTNWAFLYDKTNIIGEIYLHVELC